jgi:peptidylamidoglycolate lyase
MKYRRWILPVAFAGAFAATVLAVDMQKGGTDDFGPYNPAADWLKPVKDGFMERGEAVFVESPNRIYYTTDLEFAKPRPPGEARGGGGGARGAGGGAGGGGAAAAPASTDKHFIMILDAQGNVTEEWTQWKSLFCSPHAIWVSPYDSEKNVWVVDRDCSQVFEFSHDGKKLEKTLGEKGVIQNDDIHFGRPADIAFAPDGSGDFYIADGYQNTRVIKFDKDAHRIKQWGSDGQGPGQFKIQVHDVATGADGKVYVADRGNSRVQVFDKDGKFLDMWPNVRTPSYIWITKDGHAWVASQQGNRLLEYDLQGHLKTYWGMYGVGLGQFDDPHNFAVDPSGNLYVSIYSTRKVGLEKFEPKAGADKSRLIGLSVNRNGDNSAPMAMATH